MGIQQTLRYQMGNNAGGHEMGADRDVRVEVPDEFDQGPSVQPVEHQTHAVRFPGFIALFIPPAEEFRRGLHEARVELGVEISKHLVSEIKRVTVHNLTYHWVLLEHLGQCLASADVAGSGAG